MIGFIITGHGNFATSMKNAVQLLSGEDDIFKAIDLLPGMSADELEKKIREELSAVDKQYDRFILFTDVAGGTPFNVSAKIALLDKRIKLITGINLPLLLNIAMEKNEDISSLISVSIQEAIEGLYLVDLA